MKHKLLIAIAVFIYSTSISQTKESISKGQISIIDEKIKDFPKATELSIAFIKNGEVSFYGAKRIDDTIEYVDNSNKVFEIGSLTKVFTSTLLANLVLQHKIDLNKPIHSYFDFPIGNKEITVLQLANHTSGLPKLPSNLDLDKADQSNPYKNYSKEDLKELLRNKLEIISDPGTAYEYSNIGAGILGYLLEVQTDLTYEELLKKYIVAKYDMKNTSTILNNINSDLVEGLDSNGNKTANWDLNALVGAGGILSNVEDLSKFAIAQLNQENKELELTRKTTFEIPEYQMEVGLAWKILKPDPENKWYMHNGGTSGYSTMFALDIENEIGIIILSNVSTFNENARNIDQLCLELMQSQY
ncbi:serine hydrolase domain-containing protein [Zunongwangia endophytica]|uniref:Serine hydrolase domain-containing protein n=1 Tax=Zunongwangia endophytica TaxID=1808945 RepID=A0ABV8HB84_9FLAO|nr:serine hydrolase domain-containing protein [Zunongwangia endophytica]MDN3593552.1 serine hydrolase domain-containing protein [Zunongwangia endophytica]